MIAAISLIQNGPVPRYFSEEQLDRNTPCASKYGLEFRRGLDRLGVHQFIRKRLLPKVLCSSYPSSGDIVLTRGTKMTTRIGLSSCVSVIAYIEKFDKPCNPYIIVLFALLSNGRPETFLQFVPR